MNIVVLALICTAIESGELTPFLTRNQIPARWTGWEGGDGALSGYWSHRPDDEKAVAILSDLRNFRLTVAQIEAQYQISCSQWQRADEIRLNNLEKVFYDWQAEVDWRRSAWVQLSIASEPRNSLQRRLEYLDALRDHIGDEAYFSGTMPSPSPNYRVADTTWKDRR